MKQAHDLTRAREFFEKKVAEWMNDGAAEVVRVLTLWATREGTPATPRIELGPYLDEYLSEVGGADSNEA